DVAAVDAALEAVVDFVLLDHPFEAAQADAARRHLAVERRHESIERLAALPVRPPQPRVADDDAVGEDVLARPHRHGAADTLAVDLVAEFNRSFGEGENASRYREFDRAIGMRLRHRDALLPGEAGAPQRHAAIDADRHQADAPVPAGVAGGLAQEVEGHALEPVAQIVPGK